MSKTQVNPWTLQAVRQMTVYLTDMSRLRDYGRIKAAFIPGPSQPQLPSK